MTREQTVCVPGDGKVPCMPLSGPACCEDAFSGDARARQRKHGVAPKPRLPQ